MATELVEAPASILTAAPAIERDSQNALDQLAAAQSRAYEAVRQRKEKWVSYTLLTGELGPGDDDYQRLLGRLVEIHGKQYYTQVSVIGPNE